MITQFKHVLLLGKFFPRVGPVCESRQAHLHAHTLRAWLCTGWAGLLPQSWSALSTGCQQRKSESREGLSLAEGGDEKKGRQDSFTRFRHTHGELRPAAAPSGPPLQCSLASLSFSRRLSHHGAISHLLFFLHVKELGRCWGTGRGGGQTRSKLARDPYTNPSSLQVGPASP